MNFLLLTLIGIGLGGSTAPLSQPVPLWGPDILIWDMSENSTWVGPGYTYCDGIYDLRGNEYAATIMDSLGTSGDLMKIFSKTDTLGGSWEYRTNATGGLWNMTDPELVLHGNNPDPDSNYITVFVAATIPDSATTPWGFRLNITDFSFNAFLQPSWPFTADTLKSISVVCEPISNELWLFGEDTDRNILLTRSTDDGDNWTIPELIADDAERPSASIGANGWVYMAFKRFSDNMIMCTAFSDISFYEVEISQGSSSSAPICAADQGSNAEVAVIYHDQSFEIIMALSADSGATWNTSPSIAHGMYPFIDVYRESGRCALTYIDHLADIIYFSSAAELNLLPSVRPDAVSGQLPFNKGPAVIRHGILPTEVALFYMGRGMDDRPRDLWYDTSLLTGVSGTETGTVFTTGPNPFTSYAGISFTLETPMECALDIYSMDGRLVETVYSGFTPGENLQAGGDLPSGVYTVVFRSGTTISSRRIVKI